MFEKASILEKPKKVLFLGGFPQMTDIVNKAKEMGIYTIVVDMDSNSPAKKVSDKSYDISTNEIESLVEICNKEEIDGIFNGFEDFNIHIARKLCERMELPFYANEKQLELVTIKDKFKNECMLHGIEVVRQFSLDEAIKCKEYPYIIKPVDSYGSRGISICYSEDDLAKGKIKAEESSKTNSVIIEQFIDSNCGTELFYTIVNGKVHLTATADRYTYKMDEVSVPLPIAEVFPTKYRGKELSELDVKFKKMIYDLGIKNGLILIQMLNKGDKFYPYEMAYRLTGEQHYQLVEEQRHVDLGKMMIKLCMNEDISDYDTEDIDSDKFIKPSANLAVLLKPGKIDKIRGLEILENMPEIKSSIVTHKENEYIEDIGDYSRILLRVNLVAENQMKLSKAIELIQDSIVVVSDQGEEMVASHFSLD